MTVEELKRLPVGMCVADDHLHNPPIMKIRQCGDKMTFQKLSSQAQATNGMEDFPTSDAEATSTDINFDKLRATCNGFHSALIVDMHNARLYQEKELVPEPVTITVGHEVGVFLRGTQAKGFMGLRVTNCGVFVAAKRNEKAANCVFLQFALLNSPLPCDTTAPEVDYIADRDHFVIAFDKCDVHAQEFCDLGPWSESAMRMELVCALSTSAQEVLNGWGNVGKYAEKHFCAFTGPTYMDALAMSKQDVEQFDDKAETPATSSKTSVPEVPSRTRSTTVEESLANATGKAVGSAVSIEIKCRNVYLAFTDTPRAAKSVGFDVTVHVTMGTSTVSHDVDGVCCGDKDWDKRLRVDNSEELQDLANEALGSLSSRIRNILTKKVGTQENKVFAKCKDVADTLSNKNVFYFDVGAATLPAFLAASIAKSRTRPKGHRGSTKRKNAAGAAVVSKHAKVPSTIPEWCEGLRLAIKQNIEEDSTVDLDETVRFLVGQAFQLGSSAVQSSLRNPLCMPGVTIPVGSTIAHVVSSAKTLHMSEDLKTQVGSM